MSLSTLCLIGVFTTCLTVLFLYCLRLESKLIRYRVDNLRLVKLNTSLIETLEQMEAQQNFPDPDRSKAPREYPLHPNDELPRKSWMTGNLDSIKEIITTSIDKPIINIDTSEPPTPVLETPPGVFLNDPATINEPLVPSSRQWKRYQKLDSAGQWVHSDFADGPWTPME